MQASNAAVIGLESRRAKAAPRQNPATLMDAVFSAGSLLLRPDDRPAKAVAVMLSALGFFVIDEIGPDGAVTRLRPGGYKTASPANAWRVIKADLGAGAEGVPDAAPAA
jgi:hypothetical protein